MDDRPSTRKAQHSSFDARIAQAEASHRLHDLLHLARVNRDVADWLYKECPEAGRVFGILSPETFMKSSGITTVLASIDLAVPLTDETSNAYSEVFIYDWFVPVKQVNGICFGYSFHSASTRRGVSYVRNDIFPKSDASLGRYVYKKDARLLLILRKNVANTSVIMHIHWTSDTSRDICYCVIPRQQYTFDNHPRVVICWGASYGDCLRQETPRKADDKGFANVMDVDITGDDTLPNGPADFVNGDWREDNINSLPQCMFQDLNDGNDNENEYYKDSSAWLNEDQKRSLSGQHSKGLIQFETRRRRYDGSDTPSVLLEGNFFSAHVVREIFDECGSLAKRVAFEMRTDATVPEADCMEVLRKVGAQVYYGVVLWASTDQCLVAAQQHQAGKLLWDKGEQEDG